MLKQNLDKRKTLALNIFYKFTNSHTEKLIFNFANGGVVVRNHLERCFSH
jgi:hypothetical protein